MRRHGASGVVVLASRPPISSASDVSSRSDSESASDASDHHTIENEQLRGNQSTSKRRARTSSSDKIDSDTKPHRVTSYEVKKAVEKKFRTRYRTLQEAYESRLHALALQVQQVVTQIQNDTTVFCLQENPLTSEFASIRLGEIVHECFFGEREKYIKVVSDQVAWQASDLREVQRKLRLVQQREKDAQQKWKQVQRDAQSARRQLDARVEELQGQKRVAVQQEERFQTLREEKDVLQLDLDKAKLSIHSFEALQREHEALQVRNQNENEREQAAQDKFTRFSKEIEALKAVNVKLEMEKNASEQDIAHVQHLLSLAEAKSRDLSDSLRHQQSRDFPSKIARLEAELSHANQAYDALQQENDELKKKYQDFGSQVEVFMKEQAHEKATVLKKSEEQVRHIQAQLDAARRQGDDALKAKQVDLVRLADQLKFRQEALLKAEQNAQALEERVNIVESQIAEEKLQGANHVSKLEKEIAHWRNQVEKEREKLHVGEKSLEDMKDKYESKISTLKESFEKKFHQSVKEREAEARTRWQNDFVAKQEARIEALKAKYDSALENQQSELLRARQQALDSAAAITAKYETTKRSQRESDELDRKQRAEAASRERTAKDDERAREIAHRRMQTEFEEREKLLVERERLLLEKERSDERRRAESAQKAAAVTPSPSVVVLNMQATDDTNDEQRPSGNGKAVDVMNKISARRAQHREDTHHHEGQGETIPKTQHLAELQAREAQLMLQNEEKLQKALLELQTRKEKEFRAAMVNVRKGIQKLEASVDDAKKEKKRLEHEVLRERQAFVALKHEFDDAKEARLTVVQRLEEANDNIGKLRTVVKETGKKCQRLEEQVKMIQESERQNIIIASEVQERATQLSDELDLLSKLKVQQEAELKVAMRSQEQLQGQVGQLQGELQRCNDVLKAEKRAIREKTREEISSASSQFEYQLKQLEIRETETRSLLSAAEGTIDRLEAELRELKEEKMVQETNLQQIKLDHSQQRKEFSNLMRIHKNLAETMDKRVKEEIVERQRVEALLFDAHKEINNIKLHKQRVLLVYKMHLGQLKKDMLEMRKAVKTELKVSIWHLEKDFTVTGGHFEKQVTLELQNKIGTVQGQLESERTQWQQQLHRKEQEISGLFGSQRVNDQSKYDQITQRLENKTQELKNVEAQLLDEKGANASLQLALHKLENDAERLKLEHSHLHEQLSNSKVSLDRNAGEQERIRAALGRTTRACRVFHNFVMSIMKAHSLSPSGMLRESDASWQEKLDEQQLTTELDRAAESLYESSQKAILRAKEEGRESVLGELEAAKNALHALWSHEEAGDSVYQRLPWYAGASRAVKQLRDDAKREYAALKVDAAAKDAQIQELRQRKVQLQEANNLLRFEKETIVREMSLLSQNLSRKRDQDVQEVRLDLERKMEQAKHTYGTDKMKADQDYQVRSLKMVVDTITGLAVFHWSADNGAVCAYHDRSASSFAGSRAQDLQHSKEPIHDLSNGNGEGAGRAQGQDCSSREGDRRDSRRRGEMEAKGEACGEVDDVEHRGRKHSNSHAFPHVGILARHRERLGEVVQNGIPAPTDTSHPSYSAGTSYAKNAKNAKATIISDRGSVESYGGIAAQSTQGLSRFPQLLPPRPLAETKKTNAEDQRD